MSKRNPFFAGNALLAAFTIAIASTALVPGRADEGPASSNASGWRHYIRKYEDLSPFLPFVGIYHYFTGIEAGNNPIGARYSYPHPHVLKLEPRELGKCLAAITLEQPGGYSYTQSSMKLASLHGKSGQAPTFLEYLGAEANRAYDFETGQEPALRDWILSRPDESITLADLYRESLSLNSGNIWNGILTIHQLLRNNARWWATDRYDYRSTKEEQEALFNKLVDIRGDLEERGARYWGDHGGSWYRIWGVMLYRLSLEDEKTIFEPARFGTKERLYDLFVSSVVTVDEYGKLLQGSDEDSGKARIDREGGDAISEMLRELRAPGQAGPCSAYLHEAASDSAPQPLYRVRNR